MKQLMQGDEDFAIVKQLMQGDEDFAIVTKSTLAFWQSKAMADNALDRPWMPRRESILVCIQCCVYAARPCDANYDPRRVHQVPGSSYTSPNASN